MSAPATPLAAPAADQIAYAARGLFVPSLTNRKNFNQVKLQAMADTMRAHGIQQPLIVRKLPSDRLAETKQNTPARQALPVYEIVAGERRWLAADLAGLKQVPIIVRELTDSEALDIQLIENLAREDLTPLEEGEAFAHRIEHGGLTAEQVGAKVGRSREYVYSKTKLLDLCLEAKDALRNELIDASHALRIARIPDAKLQLKALEYATTARPGSAGDKPSVTDFMRWLQQNVMLKLNSAVFKITDANLLADAGSCKDCMKRTGANPDIFSDVDGADICTDPPCFNKKSDAHRATILKKAEAKGMRVIDGAEAKKICSANSSALKGYSPLTQQRMDVNDDSNSAPKLGKLLGKDAPDPVLIENPYTKELIEAVPTVEAEAVLLAKGLIKATTAAKSKDDDLKYLTDRLKAGLKRACEKGARLAMYSALMEAIRATPDDNAAALVSPAVLRVWLTDRMDVLDNEDTADVLQVPLDKENASTTNGDAAKLRLQACDDATVFRAMAIYLIQDERGVPYGVDATPHPIFDAMASRTRLNLHVVRKEAEQEVKDDTAEQIRKLKLDHAEARKPAQKQPAPTTPLAQPKGTPPATANAGSKSKAKGQKMSAEDAQSGIAQAMQGIEATAPAAASLAVLAVGQAVTITSNEDHLQLRLRKWAGKKGTITAKIGPEAWDVTFKGRSGGLAGFASNELVLA